MSEKSVPIYFYSENPPADPSWWDNLFWVDTTSNIYRTYHWSKQQKCWVSTDIQHFESHGKWHGFQPDTYR